MLISFCVTSTSAGTAAGLLHLPSLRFPALCVGVSNSNSYWLSNAAGWKGMLIEADPILYKNMTAARPEAICVNAAVCDDFKVRWPTAEGMAAAR